MKIASTTVIALCAFSFAFATSLDETPVRSLDTHGARLAALGACDITSQDAQCWNMDGQRDLALTNRIKSRLSASNQEISFRFQEKNIFLVVEISGQGGLSLSRYPQGYWYSVYLNQTAQQGQLELVRVNPEEEPKPVLLAATIGGIPGPPPVTLNSTPGSTARIGDLEFTMGNSKLQNLPPDRSGRVFSQGLSTGFHADKQWLIPIGLNQAFSASALQFELEDKAGKTIRYVDRKGRPLSSLSFLEGRLPAQPAPGYYSPSYNQPNFFPDPEAKNFPAYVQQSQTAVPGAFTVETDVDPQFIGGLKLSTTTSEMHPIGPFPLAPNN